MKPVANASSSHSPAEKLAWRRRVVGHPAVDRGQDVVVGERPADVDVEVADAGRHAGRVLRVEVPLARAGRVVGRRADVDLVPVHVRQAVLVLEGHEVLLRLREVTLGDHRDAPGRRRSPRRARCRARRGPAGRSCAASARVPGDGTGSWHGHARGTGQLIRARACPRLESPSTLLTARRAPSPVVAGAKNADPSGALKLRRCVWNARPTAAGEPLDAAQQPVRGDRVDAQPARPRPRAHARAPRARNAP